MQLETLGWNKRLSDLYTNYIQEHALEESIPLRIIRENREQYIAMGTEGEYRCEVTGKYRYTHFTQSEYPNVGDWVAATPVHNGNKEERKAQIHALIPRGSSFSRKVPGVATEEQVVAANIDTVFIVTGLDDNFNIRRIERYISLAWDSGAVPVLLLNKADLCHDIASRMVAVEEVSSGADIHILSAVDGSGVPELRAYTGSGKTVAFLGSSGVGKSTIINALVGYERQAVTATSTSNTKGRHTTTHRELILLPDGGMVVDTPGMREIQVWGDEEGLHQAFDDIEELASMCRFSDCKHNSEPGCAVKAALESGELNAARYASYLKLRREFAHLARRQSVRAMREEREKWKGIAKFGKSIQKAKRGEY